MWKKEERYWQGEGEREWMRMGVGDSAREKERERKWKPKISGFHWFTSVDLLENSLKGEHISPDFTFWKSQELLLKMLFNTGLKRYRMRNDVTYYIIRPLKWKNPLLCRSGDGERSEQYVELISSSWVGWYVLSPQWISSWLCKVVPLPLSSLLSLSPSFSVCRCECVCLSVPLYRYSFNQCHILFSVRYIWCG